MEMSVKQQATVTISTVLPKTYLSFSFAYMILFYAVFKIQA